MKARVLSGVFVAAAYVGTAALSHHLGAAPVRPVFDGLAPPPPYHFVSPPPEFADANQEPEGLSAVVGVENGRTKYASLPTPDGQAQLVFPDDAFDLRPRQRLVAELAPLDPAKIGPPPEGLDYAGNAYRIRVFDDGDRSPAVVRPAVVRKEATSIIRYPAHATTLLRRTGAGWEPLRVSTLQPTLQLVVMTKELGTFVAAAPVVNRWGLWWAVGVVSGVAAILGVVLGLRERQRVRRQTKR